MKSTDISKPITSRSALLASALILAHAAPSAMAATGTWTNSTTGPGNWSDATKWTGSIPSAAGDVANFNLNYGSNAKTITIDTTPRSVGTMTIGDPGVTYWVITIAASGGGSLTFDNGASPATLTKAVSTNNVVDIISTPVSLASNLAIESSATGDAQGVNLTISGAVGGSGGIVKNGTSGIQLSSPNTYAGGTTLNAGKLHIGSSTALGTGTITFAGGEIVPRGANRNVPNPLLFAADLTVGVLSINNQMGFSGAADLGGATRTITVTDTTAATDSVFSGGMSNGGLIKAGAGTLQLGGASTYTGPTNVSAGVLTLAGSLSGSEVTVASGATFSETNVGTIGGNVAFTTSGTATLAGSNTYTGATTVNGGTLTLSGSNPIDGTSGVSINGAGAKLANDSGTILAPVTLTQGALDSAGVINSLTVAGSAANTVSVGNGASSTLQVGSLAFQGAATLNIRANTTLGDQYIFADTLTTSASGPITVNLTNTAGAWTTGVDYPVIDYGTYGSAANASHFVLGTMPGLNPTQTATLVNTGGEIVVRITGDTLKWTGSQNSNWTTAAVGGARNWTFLSNGVEFTNGSNVSFDDNTSNPNVNIAQNVSPGTVIVESGFTDYFFFSSGGFGIQTGSLTKSGDARLTLTNPNGYTGTTTIHGGILELSGAGSISASSAITNDAQLIFTLSGAGTYANPIGGTGSITQAGSGALTLSGANTFTGGVALESGTLNINSAGALGAGATGTISIIGGALNNSSAADVVVTSSKLQSWGGDFTFTGTKNLDMGGGTVTVVGPDFARTVTVNAGILTVGEIKTTVQGLTKEGAGTLAFGSIGSGNASSVVNGPLTVNGGTLQINRTGAVDAATTGDFTVTGLAGTGTITNGSEWERWLYVNASAPQVFDGTLANGSTGALGLVKQGVESLTLHTVNSYTGPTNIEGGTLIVQNGGAMGGGTVSIRNRAGGLRLEGNINVPNNFLLSNDASTAGALGYAILNASGNNVLSGNISIVDGGGHALIKSNDGALNITGNVTNGLTQTRTLILGGESTGANAVSGVISNAVGGSTTLVNKVDVGTWTLAGANTYTGVTSVTAGTLQVTGTLGNTPVTVGGGTLSLPQAGAITQNTVSFSGGSLLQTVDNAISGTAGVNIQVPFTLSVPNNYSGDTSINAGANTALTVIHPNAAGTGRFFAANTSTTPIINLHINGGGVINMPNGMGGNSGVVTTIDVNNNGSGSNGLISLAGVGVYANGTLNVTGGNGYNLSIAGFTNNAGTGGTATLNPTTANLTLGTYSSTSANAKVLRLDGTSTGNSVTGEISNGTAGTVSINKTNTSTWTLSGANSYTGSTTVTQGTLTITQATLSDTAALVIGSPGAVLNLTHSSTDQVGSLTINGVAKGNGVYDATTDPGFITGTGKIRVGSSGEGYSSWASGFPFTTGVNDGPEQDADGDGINNVLEYVLGGIPVGAGANDTSILPTQSLTSTDLVLTFRRSDVSESDAVVKVQWSTTLGAWNDFATIGPVSALPAVTVTEDSPTAALDTVVVRIPRTNAAGQKLFGRVVATKP